MLEFIVAFALLFVGVAAMVVGMPRKRPGRSAESEGESALRARMTRRATR